MEKEVGKTDTTVPATEPRVRRSGVLPVCLGGPQEIGPKPGAHKRKLPPGKVDSLASGRPTHKAAEAWHVRF